MKYIIDVPVDYICITGEGTTLQIPYFLSGGIMRSFRTNIFLEPYEGPESTEIEKFVPGLHKTGDSE